MTRTERIVVLLCLTLAAIFAWEALLELADGLSTPVATQGWAPDGDRQTYIDAASRWLAGGGFYLDRQLHGPYEIAFHDILYPPPALLLFVPFTVLPGALWYAIPLGIIVGVVAYHRPRPIAWPIIAAAIWWPPVLIHLVSGNPVIWAAAGLALGTIWPGASVLAVFKPSLFPFGLLGARHRSWWMALAALVVLSALFLPMWPDYLRVVMDSRNPRGIIYSWEEVPLMLVPVVASALRMRRATAIARTSSRRVADPSDSD